MSPETATPFPDRPIRPLPKRPLRERLSPDVAQTIKYPPAPKTATPLFYYGYNLPESGSNGAEEAQHPSERERADEIERTYISRRNGEELDSDEDEQAYRSRIYSRPLADPAGRSYRYVQKPDSKHPNQQPPASTASSADGYDSFENTNNKKKRKIPTPGDSNLNGVHLSSDMAGMGISGPDDLVEDVGIVGAAYHGSVNTIQGISGPGRGRYGRIRNGRSPLRTLSDATSNWGNGRTTKQRHSQWPAANETTGIISESIATANAEKIPITPSRGQENVSILQQQASKKSSPASTQFTFTCDSQVPATIPWPGPSSSANMHQSPAAAAIYTNHKVKSDAAWEANPRPGSRPLRSTDISKPNIGSSLSSDLSASAVVARGKQNLAAAQQDLQQATNSQKQALPQAAPPKKTRRRSGKELLIAARQRREQQKWRNEHHPIPREDQWTCEFCEYEQIFGTPPVALIKQYEIKDRHARKQEAERRRLLEKAKMKGRKGKKGSKAAPKAAPAAAQQAQQPAPLNQSQSQSQSQGTQTQSEEYYEDEYDDEYPQDDPPPPSPDGPTATQQPISIITDPGSAIKAVETLYTGNGVHTT